MRPSLPPSRLTGGPLMDIIRSCWDHLPSKRPSFKQIVHDVKKMRAQSLSSAGFDSPKPTPILDQWGAQNPYHPRHSPDILPQPLPDDEAVIGSQDLINPFNTLNDVEEGRHLGSALGLNINNDKVGSISKVPMDQGRGESSAAGPTRSNTMSSDTLTSDSSILDQNVLASGYLTPPDLDDMAAQYQNERRYRMLLQHDYHTIRGSFILYLVLQRN